MYENKKQKLAPAKVYHERVRKSTAFAAFILFISFLIGVIGNKLTVPEFDWYDSLLNASMILSRMGPIIGVDIILTKSAKVFALVYALFSGITFLSTFGILIAPVLRRFFYKLHLENRDNN